MDAIEQLIAALRFLPGVGPKTAQRMAYHILERARPDGLQLATSLTNAVNSVQHCQMCRTLTESSICKLCSNIARDQTTLCVVETPADVLAVEQTNTYKGLYFVLMGHLSPLDGIGPKQIGLEDLQKRLQTAPIKEIIIATNPTMEGEATAHYIAMMLADTNIKCTRIAHGVPMGGELEYLDGNTLMRALKGRQLVLVESEKNE